MTRLDPTATIASYRRAEVPLVSYKRENCVSVIWFLIIGIVAGWLAGKIMRGGGFGLIGDLVIGIIGAVLGGFLFGLLGLSSDGSLIGSLVTATVGAIVLLFLIHLVKRA